MINIIPSSERYHADHGWLDTHWQFSFSDYYDPNNMNWGPLRVFNDDIVKGGGGFDFHPHKDMEIVSYIVDGALEHRDRLGNRHVNRAGEVQVMSAGKGIVHAEANPGRHAYFFVINGEVELNGQKLQSGDQARIADETKLTIGATKDSELMLLDLP